MSTLIEKIEDAKLLGVDYKDIADRAGITTQHLYNVRKGKSDIASRKEKAVERAIRELKRNAKRIGKVA